LLQQEQNNSAKKTMAVYGHCSGRGRISVEKEQPQVVQKSRRDYMIDNSHARGKQKIFEIQKSLPALIKRLRGQAGLILVLKSKSLIRKYLSRQG